MSFFTSIQQLVSDAGQSINASARKLASSISQESNGSSDLAQPPCIEVISSADSNRKRPTGPLLLPSPDTMASIPLSPSLAAFNSRRPSLAVTPSGRKSPFGNMLDPTTNSVNLGPKSSPVSPTRRSTSCKGRLMSRNSSFRESFKRKGGEGQTSQNGGSRRQSVVQIVLNKQKPQLDTKLYPTFLEMPEKWAEVTDTRKLVSKIDNEFLEFYGSLQLCHESKKQLHFEEWKAANDMPPLQSSLGIEPVIPEVEKEECKAEESSALAAKKKENLYKEVLYTITHKLGGPGESAVSQLIQLQKKPNALSAALAPLWQSVAIEEKKHLSKQELLKYAQEAFDIDKQTHEKLMEEVKEEKPPIVILNVCVVEADNLEAKDSNGYSDPFCMLGIRPGDTVTPSSRSPREKSPSHRHRGSFDWSAISEASSALMGFGVQTPIIKTPDVVDIQEDGDSLGALPESLSKPVEKLSRKTGSFRLSFKRKDTKKAPKSPGLSSSPCHNPLANSLSTGSPGSHSNNGNNGFNAFLDPGTNGFFNGPVAAKFIRATSVKPKTLSPSWHERFRFDCDDVQTDILHLDIWDHDDEASVLDAVKRLNEVKNMRGLGRYFKQVAQSARNGEGGQDDFLGSIDIPVRDVPATGLDRWYKLEGRSNRSNIQGSIHLKLWLSTRENRGLSEEEGMWNEIWQHQQIYSIFLRHELSQLKENGSSSEWNGQLSEEASAILQQHAIQGDLTELQIAALKWRAIAQQAKDEKRQIHFKILHEVLKDLEQHWDRDLLSNEEERALGEAMCYFVEYGLLLIQHHRKLFTPQNKLAFEKLEYLLRCFHLLSEMRVTNYCYPQGHDLKQDVCNALKKGTTNWFMESLDLPSLEPLMVQSQPLTGDEYRKILFKITDLLIEVNAHLESGNRSYNSLFDRIMGINFTSTVYKQYDKLISEELSPVLIRLCERDLSLEMSDILLPPLTSETSQKGKAMSQKSSEEDEDVELTEEKRERLRTERKCTCVKAENCRHFLTYDLFEVCLAFREVHTKRKALLPSERKTLLLTNAYHDWFMPSFAAWLAVVSEQVPLRVERAVNCEKLVASILHPDLKHSTSSRDVTSCFYHIKDLWNQMGWQEVHNNRSLLAATVDIICKNASLYTDMVLKKHADLELYEGEKGFQLCDEFCIAMNNIEHVCQCVMTLPHEFCFSEERTSTSSNSSTEFHFDSNEHLLDFVVTTVDQIDLALYMALETIASRLQPAMKKHIFHLAWSPESLPTVDAISPLLGFLDQRLQDFNGRLLKGNVTRCLHIMWESVLHEIDDHVNSNNSERVPAFYDRLYEALLLLVEFFSIQGKGLTGSKLYTDNYSRMKLLYGLNKMTTSQLIDLYHQERLNDEQVLMHQYGSSGEIPPYGVLCIRVYFRNNCLFVEVIRAHDVIPLDNNGLSDPFVVVELLPRRVFQSAEQQTHVQKATLNPVFDECFEFPAYYDQLIDDDAMLLFSVYDHDVLSYNDFGGEAFLPLRDVPGVQKGKQPSVGNFHGLKHVELALMFQENVDNPVLKVLTDRLEDREAQDFVKKQKERLLRC